jgi:hypothetical protein
VRCVRQVEHTYIGWKPPSLNIEISTTLAPIHCHTPLGKGNSTPPMPLRLLSASMLLAVLFTTTTTTTTTTAHHLRYSAAYAWNVSSLSPAAFNLAQTSSVDGARSLAARHLPSALAAFQGPIFVRNHVAPGGSVLAPGWEAKLDALLMEMQPYVKVGAIEAVFLGDEVCCHGTLRSARTGGGQTCKFN